MGLMGPMPPPGAMNRNGPMITHPPFDLLMAESHFGKADPPKEENEMNDALLRKTQQLTPSTAEQSSVQNLVSKVLNLLSSLNSVPFTLVLPIITEANICLLQLSTF